MDEEESINQLYNQIIEQLDCSYEIIFIDDGSTDNSLNIIKGIAQKDKNVKAISFRKNMGKSVALQTGFNHAKGSIVFTMDADLQDEPSEISKFIAEIENGYDVVSGWKYHRKDSAEKRLPSKLFNKTVSMFSGVHLHDFNCGFKAYRNEVVKSVNLYGDLHRFIPVLASQKGFSITEIKVTHNKRQFGKSKYGFERYLRGFFDALTVGFLSKYYDRPMHLFGRFGLLSIVIGLIICFYLVIQWFLGYSIGTRPLLMLGVLCILVGIQLFSIGFIGDIIVAKNFKNNYNENHVKEYI